MAPPARARLLPHALLPAALALLAAAPGARGDTLTYRGEAVDLKTRAPVFSEHHTEVVADGRTESLRTVYVGPAGDTLAVRTLDFTGSPYLPRYRLEDFRTGLLEGARAEGNDVVVFHRLGRGKPMTEKRLRAPDPAVLDGGFNVFLKRNWEALEAGRHLRFHVVVPSRKALFRFSASGNAPGEKGLRTVVAEPRNAVVRLVAPRIEVVYDADTRRIKRYRGYSNLSRADGSAFEAEVTYAGLGP